MGENPDLLFPSLTENVCREPCSRVETRTHHASRPLQDVLHRHALYLIVRMVCYDDGLGAGRSLLALKTADASSEEVSLWVYQCSSLVSVPLLLTRRHREAEAEEMLRVRPWHDAHMWPPPAVRASCGGPVRQGHRVRGNPQMGRGSSGGRGPTYPGVSFLAGIRHHAHRSQEHGREHAGGPWARPAGSRVGLDV